MADDSRRFDWIELIATVLLAVSALATSWSSYQATRWNGEQVKAGGRANALRVLAARSDGLARSQTQVDVATFIAWAEADVAGNTELEDFYVQRFRPEFKPAFEAWLATDPTTNPEAPPTPFVMDEYQLAAAAEAERLEAEADLKSAQVSAFVQRSGDYVLGVVMFAVALFFAGMCVKLKQPVTRRILLTVGCAVFLVALLRILTFPIKLVS